MPRGMKTASLSRPGICPKAPPSCIPQVTSRYYGHRIRAYEPRRHQTDRPKPLPQPSHQGTHWSATIPAHVRLSIPFDIHPAARTLHNHDALHAVWSLQACVCGRAHTHCIGVESVKKAVIDTHQLAYAISVAIFKLIPIPVEPIRFQN